MTGRVAMPPTPSGTCRTCSYAPPEYVVLKNLRYAILQLYLQEHAIIRMPTIRDPSLMEASSTLILDQNPLVSVGSSAAFVLLT